MSLNKPSPEDIQTQIHYRLIEKLEASERRYRVLVENLQEIIFSIDREGKFTFLNPAWQKNMGYSVTSSLQTPLISFLHSQNQKLDSPVIKSLLQDQSILRQELCFQHLNGQIVWLELSASFHPDGGASGTLTNISEKKEAILQLKYAAYHDSLTGLHNRVAFMDYLTQEIANSGNNPNDIFALLFLDLDGFKLVNDSFGHIAGDRLLIEVAARLKCTLRPQDIIARFGGDEFIILLPKIANINNTIRVSENIQKALKPAFIIDSQEIFIGTSIGIVLSTDGEQEATKILRNGDIALYKAKAKGKGTYEVFDSKMLAQIMERMSLETHLRKGLNKNEFEVFYQPIIEAENRGIIGFEALLRWHHPVLGMVSPGTFIPIAEETGLIIELGWQVFSQACHQLRLWQQKYPQAKSWFISINLSIRQFAQASLVSRIEEILSVTNLAPQNLKLEITESIMMSNTQVNIAKIKRIKNLGVQISIDDFGTGYSSLSYLHRFPIDIIKIDRSFVSLLGECSKNQKIIEAIILLAHKLGMKVVAEGVETENQLAILRLLKCEGVQGYLFARPLPIKSLEKVFANLFENELINNKFN